MAEHSGYQALLETVPLRYLWSCSPQNGDALRNAFLQLPHLIRAHGLGATLHYRIRSDGEDKTAAETLLNCLHELSPITGAGADGKAIASLLANEPHSAYLLHTRLALRMSKNLAEFAVIRWPVTNSVQTMEVTP